MAKKKPNATASGSSSDAGMWAFRIAVVLMIAGMAGFVLYDSYASKKQKTVNAAEAASAAAMHEGEDGSKAPAASAAEAGPPTIALPPEEEQPWEAAADAEVPEGHLSAAEVQPPGPEPTLTAPEAVPPPDPRSNEPPRHNPGGVNGDRPAREVPGMDGTDDEEPAL